MNDKIIFWQHMASHPTSDLISSLAADTNLSVRVFVEEKISETRKNLGWLDADHGRAYLEALPRRGYRHRIIQIIEKEKSAFHIFCGTQRHRRIRYALKQAIRAKVRLGVMSEPPINQERGLKKILKGIYLRWLPCQQRGIIQASRFVLAITAPNDQTFRKIGWPSDKIFTFGYFSAVDMHGKSRESSDRKVLRLAYVGQLARHKGLLVLMDALRMLERCGTGFSCSIWGEGPLRGRIAQMDIAKQSNCLMLKGTLPYSQIADAFLEADIYVAPGINEPWGLTINEAIQTATPVIVSKGIRGGSALVEHGGCGIVVEPNNANELAKALIEMIQSTCKRETFQKNCLILRQLITPDVAAKYVRDVLAFVENRGPFRPMPPWFYS